MTPDYRFVLHFGLWDWIHVHESQPRCWREGLCVQRGGSDRPAPNMERLWQGQSRRFGSTPSGERSAERLGNPQPIHIRGKRSETKKRWLIFPILPCPPYSYALFKFDRAIYSAANTHCPVSAETQPRCLLFKDPNLSSHKWTKRVLVLKNGLIVHPIFNLLNSVFLLPEYIFFSNPGAFLTAK